LGGPARVLLTGCRPGDGASTVAGALALDLSRRLGVDTLLVEAGADGGAAEAAGGSLMRINSGGAALWTARCMPHAVNGAAGESGLARGGGAGERLLAALQAAAGPWRAAVIDLGVVRLDARMLVLARPEDPVLIVARYGATRREELSSTAAVLKLAKCRA